MNKYRFDWNESHTHTVNANSVTEAREQFDYEQGEGFGGQSSYSESDTPVLVEINDELTGEKLNDKEVD